MPLFLITFLSVYGGMHLYVFIRLHAAFGLRLHLKWLLIIWMSVMTFAPLLVRATEQSGLGETARFLAWPGYLWMGFLFILTSTLLFTDVVACLAQPLFRRFHPRLSELFSLRNRCALTLILAMFVSIYAYYEAGQIRREHIVISSPKIAASVSRVRIVQISDVHIGLLLQQQRFERIVAMIREADPDILVSTGDLLDGKLNRADTISERTELASSLAAISAPAGKFAVIGNHEVYAGLAPALAFTRAAGFTILRNRSISVENSITLTGVDDRAAIPGSSADTGLEIALLKAVPRAAFNILLKHRPEVVPASDGRFDLQLSGHVHGGQIFPFSLIVRLPYPIPCGTSVSRDGATIYVSRGTGTWGPPMRLFAPPEITIIDLVPKKPVG